MVFHSGSPGSRWKCPDIVAANERSGGHGAPGDPVAQQRGAGQRVRAATGPAGDGEPVPALSIGQGGHVRGRVGDGAPALPGGAAVQGTVGDQQAPGGHPGDQRAARRAGT